MQMHTAFDFLGFPCSFFAQDITLASAGWYHHWSASGSSRSHKLYWLCNKTLVWREDEDYLQEVNFTYPRSRAAPPLAASSANLHLLASSAKSPSLLGLFHQPDNPISTSHRLIRLVGSFLPPHYDRTRPCSLPLPSFCRGLVPDKVLLWSLASYNF